MPADQYSFHNRLKRILSRNDHQLPALNTLHQTILKSTERLAARRNNRPKIVLAEGLPVTDRADDIAAAIKANQVVILCGETGSGKTTQLPKICLSIGRGINGFIGHTQPRRIAARSVASRIAEEMGTELGQGVGYKVRFTDQVSDGSWIKVMTDGILLQEIQKDRYLRQYDTLIIDEAHERSLNIDFMLGYLKQLLPKRPDLKLIITSATIDPERFSKHFDDAPMLEISGRTYPVEIRYAESESNAGAVEPDRLMVDSVQQLLREGSGDILIFLSGEREIRDTADLLSKQLLGELEILPLLARLSQSEQQRVFHPAGKRRIILATNVAETSITVPRICYVVDTGLARISRYSHRSKVQQLPIEKISQASANQRSGRCGRIAAGVTVRLYSEEDFEQRDLFTQPEILRTSLASVILQASALGILDLNEFPFVEPPERRFVNDGYKLLYELGAVDSSHRLTPIGRQMARLPLDPRFARVLIASIDHDCVDEILVIAAGLSIQDPRERPMDKQQAADQKHQEYRHPESDFLSLLNLWQHLQSQRAEYSGNQFRKLCRNNFLSYVRVREWQDIEQQLRRQLSEIFPGKVPRQRPGFDPQSYAYDPIHTALLTGFLGNIARRKEGRTYEGARQQELMIFPGSGVAKLKPKWIMSAEQVETSQLFARSCAKIDPEWIENLAPHLVRYQYEEPYWSAKSGRVMALERVTLYGLPIVIGRRVDFSTKDPKVAREIFIREGLVEGNLRTRWPFFAQNQVAREEVESLEHKSRRKDILIHDNDLYAFYEEELPPQVCDARSLDKWYRKASAKQPELLHLNKEALMKHQASPVDENAFPGEFRYAGIPLKLRYTFAPGSEADGVTVFVPQAMVGQLCIEPFDWLVPGMLREKLIVMIKALPKPLRRQLVPVPDVVDACIGELSCEDGSLLEQLSRQLLRIRSVRIPMESWQLSALPEHLKMRFSVEDLKGKVLSVSRDLNQLQSELGLEQSVPQLPPELLNFEQDNLVEWSFGNLPETVSVEQAGITFDLFPALIDQQSSVKLTLLDSREKADQASRLGINLLIRLTLASQVKYLRKNLPGAQKLAIQYARLPDCPYETSSSSGKGENLIDSLIAHAVEKTYLHGALPRTQAQFEQLVESHRQQFLPVANQLAEAVRQVLTEHHSLRSKLSGNINMAWMEAVADIQQQLQHLAYKGFIHALNSDQLTRLPEYLHAINKRLDKLSQNPQADRSPRSKIKPYAAKFLDNCQQQDALPELVTYRWMLEEYRISLFAQPMKTAYPISEKRLDKQWDEVKKAQKIQAGR